MNNQIKLLMEIKKNPIIYLGQKSLILLKSFISGYSVKLYEENENYEDIFSEFQEFVSKKYDIVTDQGWSQIIHFFTTNDIEAFDCFFELLDEYLSIHSIGLDNMK